MQFQSNRMHFDIKLLSLIDTYLFFLAAGRAKQHATSIERPSALVYAFEWATAMKKAFERASVLV